MARIEKFDDIEGWKKGRELRDEVYLASNLSLETSRLISSFMKYLQPSELRDTKFKSATEAP